MEQSKLVKLLIKKEKGEISLPEQKELMSLMHTEPDATAISTAVRDIFNSSISFEPDITEYFVLGSEAQLRQRINPLPAHSGKIKRLNRPLMRTIAVAASLLVVAALSWLVFNRQEQVGTAVKNVVATHKGSKSNITLPDGTKIWINADTRLTYAKSFGEKDRVVNLEGEAYFDVVKDEKKPFIVHTRTMDVRVVGTAFNVRAYKNEKSTQTTLIRGSVEVMLKDSDKKIMLKPNEKIIVRNAHGFTKNAGEHAHSTLPEISISNVTFSPTDSEVLETQWLKSNIHFENQKLQDIIPMLENWYHVTIDVRDPALLQKRFSGKIQNESLNEVLQLFSLTSGLRYKIEEENVTIFK